jgi:hypothetical protein
LLWNNNSSLKNCHFSQICVCSQLKPFASEEKSKVRYRKIDTRITVDEKFRQLSPALPSGQSLFIHLLITPSTNVIPGLYRAGEFALAEELGWSIESFRESFRELLSKGMVESDLKARVIYIPNALKYNLPHNPNVVASWKDCWDEIPECALKKHAYENIKKSMKSMGEGYLKAFVNACLNHSTNHCANDSHNDCRKQEQEQEQDLSLSQKKDSEITRAISKKWDCEKFEKFWSAYPRRVAKAKARTSWKRQNLDVLADVIMQDLAMRTALDNQWHAENSFVPHASTYLNQRRWEDEQKVMPKENQHKNDNNNDLFRGIE